MKRPCDLPPPWSSGGVTGRRGDRMAEAAPDATPLVRAPVFSLGYEGRDVEEVLHTIQRHGIRRVIDVRENPRSRKVGFSAEALGTTLDRIGVEYVRLPELGCSGAARRSRWGGGSREAFLEEYRRRLPGRPDSMTRLVGQLGPGPSLLLCLERDPSNCHRSVLEEGLLEWGIRVTDL